MLALIIAVQFVVAMATHHSTSWLRWLPAEVGLPLWAAWTMAKVWAVKKTENQ